MHYYNIPVFRGYERIFIYGGKMKLLWLGKVKWVHVNCMWYHTVYRKKGSSLRGIVQVFGTKAAPIFIL